MFLNENPSPAMSLKAEWQPAARRVSLLIGFIIYSLFLRMQFFAFLFLKQILLVSAESWLLSLKCWGFVLQNPCKIHMGSNVFITYSGVFMEPVGVMIR